MSILLAGATGYLGSHLVRQLQAQSVEFKVIVRDSQKLLKQGVEEKRIHKAELTNPETLIRCWQGVETVISTVGITKQKDGLTYMDVDYQANLNLLNQAKENGVKKFIYVSVLNGKKLRSLKICEAKERFVDKLKTSGLDYCVIRPNGFFSDVEEIFNMSKQGRIFLFGDGGYKSNPIHGADLARVCLNAIDSKVQEINVGGPNTYTHNQIAEISFGVQGKNTTIIHIPDFVRRITLTIARTFFSVQVYGKLEFFMIVMAMDMLAPEYGTHTIDNYFKLLSKKGG